MALQYGTVSAETSFISGDAIYESKETLSAPGTGKDIILPDNTGHFDSVLVSLIVSGGGQGKIQYSLSNRADIIAGTANWFDWDLGSVNTNENDVLYHVSGVRLVNSAGTTVIEVRWV